MNSVPYSKRNILFAETNPRVKISVFLPAAESAESNFDIPQRAKISADEKVRGTKGEAKKMGDISL
jgi:hypothetical protein